jgi:putative endonuclease
MADRTWRGGMAHHAGAAAEDRVAQEYVRRGCVLSARRWRGQGGEIDLIARDGDTVIFVEVKKSRSFAEAAAHLGRTQRRRLAMAAAEYLDGEPRGALTPARFDVALMDAQGGVEILENAFDAG